MSTLKLALRTVRELILPPAVQTDGWCFRLYTERAYEQMEKRSQPEIQRVSLSFALLHLLAAGQEDVFRFEYMDRPSKESSESWSAPSIRRTAADSQHTQSSAPS